MDRYSARRLVDSSHGRSTAGTGPEHRSRCAGARRSGRAASRRTGATAARPDRTDTGRSRRRAGARLIGPSATGGGRTSMRHPAIDLRDDPLSGGADGCHAGVARGITGRRGCAAEPVDQWVKAGDGTRLLVRQSRSGRSLVLVHPSSGGLDSFAPIAPLFDGLELWAYARRGYAPSESPVRQKAFADDVADLQAVIAATGGPVDVLGASYGATVALHAAHTDSSQIRSLVLFEPPLFAAGPALTPVLERYRAHVDQGSLAEAAWLFAAGVARVPGPLLDALTPAGDDAAADPAEAVGCLHALEAMAHDDTEIDRWADVDVPVLLLQGEKTWAPVPATMDALAAVLPSVTRVVLAGQAHFATHTAPALFAQAVTKFLAAT